MWFGAGGSNGGSKFKRHDENLQHDIQFNLRHVLFIYLISSFLQSYWKPVENFKQELNEDCLNVTIEA